jgi:hypothetical protein
MARQALPKSPPGTGATRVFSGARAIFFFNGEVVGFASGVSGSEEIQYEPVDTLDHLEVREFVPVAYRCTLTAQVFRTISIGASEDVNGPGSLKQQQIFPKFDDIFRILGVDALVQDDPRLSDKVLHQFQGVKTASYNFNIPARGIVTQNVTFVAIRAFDESEVSP